MSRELTPRWYSPAEVAVLLGFGISKVKMKIATGELRSIKDGKYRPILPEGSTSTSATRSSGRMSPDARPCRCQRRRLDLSVPQRLRRYVRVTKPDGKRTDNNKIV